jgi:hypothetical protein
MINILNLKRKRLTDQEKFQAIEAIAVSKNREIEICENPVSYPVKLAEVPGYDFQGGLINSSTLQLVEQAILIRHNKDAQAPSQLNLDNSSISAGLSKKSGAFFFGGILFNNFGHFLLESIGRLWAYSLFHEFDLPVLFYAPWGIPDYKKEDNYIHQLFKGFDIPVNRLIFLNEPVQLEKVIIPKLKYGFGKCRKPDGTFLSFIQSFRLPDHLPKAARDADKIYVSRSQLPFKQGRPFGETLFEKYLQANSYIIIYPEKYTLYEQLSLYKRAKKIIFCDGGATYGTILLPGITAAIAIVARRRDHRWNYKEITEHFLGYKKPVLWIDEIICQYQFGLESWDAAAEVDWFNVSVALKKEGFTENLFEKPDMADFEVIKKRELQQYIESIHTNPVFINYMQKLKEEYPILPTSF